MSRILDRRAGNHNSPIYDPRFDDASLTEAINVAPYRTGRPAQLGIFTDTPISRTYVRIGVSEKTITVIPARERGGETNLAMRADQRGVVMANIPHFPLDDALTPADIQDIAAFDPEAALISAEQAYAEKLDNLRARHDLTHHHLDWGALNGEVRDAEGKLLFDLWSTFDIQQNIVAYDLTAPDLDIADLNRKAKAILRKELRGTAATGARVLAGTEFFDRYVSHRNVRESLQHYAGQTANPQRDEIEDSFTFAGLTLERVDEEYSIRQPNGTILTKPAIAANEAILLPLGTPYFKRFVAPPDTMSGANRVPEPETKIFISTEDLPHDKGREIHSESNVLPIPTRPSLIVRLVNRK